MIEFYAYRCLATLVIVAKLAIVSFVIYYGLFCWHEETGFFSWHPVKRIAFLIFLPIILVHKVLSAGCKCGECIWCQIAIDD